MRLEVPSSNLVKRYYLLKRLMGKAVYRICIFEVHKVQDLVIGVSGTVLDPSGAAQESVLFSVLFNVLMHVVKDVA